MLPGPKCFTHPSFPAVQMKVIGLSWRLHRCLLALVCCLVRLLRLSTCIHARWLNSPLNFSTDGHCRRILEKWLLGFRHSISGIGDLIADHDLFVSKFTSITLSGSQLSVQSPAAHASTSKVHRHVEQAPKS